MKNVNHLLSQKKKTSHVASMQTILADHSVNLEIEALSTERLLIRKFIPTDASFVLKLLNERSFIENIRDTGIRTIPEAEKYMSSVTLNHVSLKDGTPVGMCGLIKRDTLPDVDIGFAFLEEHHGKGYATESAWAILNVGFEKLHLKRIVAITTLTNTPSQNVLLKLGLHFEKNVKLPPSEVELKLFAVERPY